VRRFPHVFYLPLLLLGVFLIAFTVSSDFSQDLGRHLALGKIMVETHSVPSVNAFSYTNGTYPFLNHHWLAEVFFFLLFRAGGIGALQVLKVFLLFACVGIAYMTAVRFARPILTVGIGLVLLPFLVERSDIRPELIGYVLFSLLLWYVCNPDIQKKFSWLPVPVMAVWINVHISFVFGFVLLGVHAISGLVRWHENSKRYKPVLKILLICAASVAVLFVNPQGLDGIAYPFRIFANYGYSIVENQTMFFLRGMVFNPLITYYFLFSVPVAFGMFLLVRKRKIDHAALFLIFSLLPLWQIRHLPFFVLVALPFLSEAYEGTIEIPARRMLKSYAVPTGIGLLGVVFGILIWFFGANTYYQAFDMSKKFGWGAVEDGKAALNYVNAHPLKGNIFNNFDNGGYLIYRLYPRYRVFVDNRPEAYPKEFFQNTYIPLQEKDEVQQDVFRKYSIHTIIMAHTDQTPWARTFLARTIGDKRWRMVYLDSAYVIFSDDGQSADVRSDAKTLNDMLDAETDANGYMRLMNIFLLMGKVDLAKDAFLRAQKSNPSSCAMKRVMYEEYANSPYFYQAEELRRSSFWCF